MLTCSFLIAIMLSCSSLIFSVQIIQPRCTSFAVTIKTPNIRSVHRRDDCPSGSPFLDRHKVRVCIYLSLRLSLELFVCLSVCMSVCLSIYLSISLSISLSSSASAHLYVYVSACGSIYLPTYLPTYLLSLPTYLPIYLSIYLSICLSVYLSVSFPPLFLSSLFPWFTAFSDFKLNSWKCSRGHCTVYFCLHCPQRAMKRTRVPTSCFVLCVTTHVAD